MIAIFRIVLFGLLGLIALFVIFSLMYHQFHLRKESQKYPPPGKIVEANNTELHVYAEGAGDLTLVFLSGHGTSNPTIDFKPLWMRLSDEYRIAVVERAGYGWSQRSNNPRDIDTLLNETRKALTLAGEKGPFVLIPHSMSGLEAIYWAQMYPHEIKAIIGLDPTVPQFVSEALEIPAKSRLYVMYFISRLGLSRFMPDDELKATFPLLKSADLSQKDKEQFAAMFYRSAYTKNMLREIDFLVENAKKVSDNPVPVQIPSYFFISDGKEVTDSDWRKLLTNYLMPIDHSQYKLLESGHYLHNEEPDIIAGEIKIFLENIPNVN